MGTQSKGRRGQQDSAAERSTGVPEARVERAGIAPGVQTWNSDKLWEGIALTPAVENEHQETTGDVGGSHKMDVKTLPVRDLQSWHHLADREAKVSGGEGRGQICIEEGGPVSMEEGGRTSS